MITIPEGAVETIENVAIKRATIGKKEVDKNEKKTQKKTYHTMAKQLRYADRKDNQNKMGKKLH